MEGCTNGTCENLSIPTNGTGTVGDMSALSTANLVVELTIAVASIIGNFFVLYAIVKNRFLRRVTNFYIASLAMADLLVGLVAIPFAIIVDKNVTTDFYSCLFMNSTVVILTQISIFALLLIAIERYAAIRDPYTYHKVWTVRRSIILIAATWTLAAILGMVPLFGWNIKPEEPVCYFIKIIDMRYMVYFNFFGCVLPPLIIMFCIYSYIFCVVMKHTRRIAILQVGAKTPGEARRQRFYKELRAAKSLSVILIFFVLCWLPLHILNTLNVVCGEKCQYPVPLLFFAIWLSHANSAINPLLYAWASKDFRYAFKKATGMKVNSEDYPDHTLANTVNDNQIHSASKGNTDVSKSDSSEKGNVTRNSHCSGWRNCCRPHNEVESHNGQVINDNSHETIKCNGNKNCEHGVRTKNGEVHTEVATIPADNNNGFTPKSHGNKHVRMCGIMNKSRIVTNEIDIHAQNHRESEETSNQINKLHNTHVNFYINEDTVFTHL